MKHSITYLLLFSVLLFSSCSDPEEEVSTIVGSWNLVSWDIKTTSPPTDWTPFGQECRLDNIEEFSSNGTWTSYDGTIQCPGGNGIGIYTGTWKFAANNTKVLFTYDWASGEYERTVETLNENTLVLSFSSGSLDGMQNRITYSKN